MGTKRSITTSRKIYGNDSYIYNFVLFWYSVCIYRERIYPVAGYKIPYFYSQPIQRSRCLPLVLTIQFRAADTGSRGAE